MPRMGRLWLACSLLCVMPTTASAKWTRLQAPNFTLVGEVSESTLRRMAQHLERFRLALLQALPGTPASAVPTTVIVFGSTKSLAPYRPQFEGRPVEVAGYFLGGEDSDVIAVNGELGDAALATVYHEYGHAVTANQVGYLPPWVGEGIAELYETFETSNGERRALIGRAPGHHVQLLRQMTLIPLRELFGITHSSAEYNEGRRRGVLYAQSWALVHYLAFGAPQRSGQLQKFIAALSLASNQEEAARVAFGADLAALERELREYVAQFAFSALQLDFDQKLDVATSARGQAVSDDEAAVVLADLLGRLGREEEARASLTRFAKNASTSARAAVAMAMLELRKGDSAQAWKVLEPFAGAPADDAAVQSVVARTLIARLSTASLDRAERDSATALARTALTRVMDLQPDQAYPAAMLGYVELARGEDYTRAETLLARASTLAPAREDYRVLHAEALARQGNLQRATEILGALLARGARAETRAAARAALGHVARLRAAKDAPAVEGRVDEALRLPDELGNLVGVTGSAATVTTTRSEPVPAVVPQLRKPGSGESRLLGVFRAIECRADFFTLVFDTESGAARVGSKRFDEIEFITYRSQSPGEVACGPVAQPTRALVTYRSGSAEAGGDQRLLGTAVAVELLPDDYTPPLAPDPTSTGPR